MYFQRPVATVLLMAALLQFTACYRETIQFAGDPPPGYTTIVRIDTITPQVSTVITDSFTTGSASSFLMGSIADPHLGTITARAFMQMGLPGTEIDIPEHAVFDSLTLLVPLNHYYYGDTQAVITAAVHELDETIALGYNDHLYNTSNFQVKTTALGSRQLRIRPLTDTVFSVRLSDAKGMELFNKLKRKDNDVLSSDDFLLYCKGIRLSATVAGAGTVYGIGVSGDTIRMRLHYHTTIPYPEEKHLDFPRLENALSFRQILVTRNGTLPDPVTAGRNEFPSASTGHMAFTQAGTGVLMKVLFPSLRNILSTDMPVNLLQAELIVRPVEQSFVTLALPPALRLSQTDESNFIGSFLADSSGVSILAASPVIDPLYGLNNHYRFNITNYINQLLQTPGSGGTGFFLVENHPSSTTRLHRGVFGDASLTGNNIQLVLHVLTVKTT